MSESPVTRHQSLVTRFTRMLFWLTLAAATAWLLWHGTSDHCQGL